MKELKRENIERFLTAAQAFCDICLDESQRGRQLWAKEVQRRLTYVFAHWLELKAPDSACPHTIPLVNDEQRKKVWNRVARRTAPYNSYWTVLESITPLGENTPSCEIGSLEDDLADVFVFLKSGLESSSRDAEDAVLYWTEPSLRMHFTRHTLSALRVLAECAAVEDEDPSLPRPCKRDEPSCGGSGRL